MLRDQLQQLAQAQQGPCVTISFATHRTHPDNLADAIQLKNLVKEAEERLLKEYDKRAIAQLLENLQSIEKEINHEYNTEGLYIFASNEVKEIIKTSWPPESDSVELDNRFSLRNLIKSYNRSETYYILYLSQSGVQLYEALNDRVIAEIKEGGFPFKENTHYHTDSLKNSDPKSVDNKLKEYFNRIDKGVVHVLRDSGLHCIVASTKYNYDLLLSVADVPQIYSGHIPVDYNNNDLHHLASAAWEVIAAIQKQRRADAIGDVLAAISAGKVVTDIQEIWRAAHEGRGDTLLVRNELSIPAGIFKTNIEVNEDRTTPGVTDDIVSDIAWQVLSKNGKVYFTDQPQLEQLGEIALKVRY